MLCALLHSNARFGFELNRPLVPLYLSSVSLVVVVSARSSQTDIARFSGALNEGPVNEKVLTCMDRELVTVNQRGSLTVALVDNMLCVAEDNSQDSIIYAHSHDALVADCCVVWAFDCVCPDPSKGSYLFPPSSLSTSEFSALKSSQIGLYAPADPVALQAAAEFQAQTASSDNFYKVGSYVKAAKEAADTSYYTTHGSVRRARTQMSNHLMLLRATLLKLVVFVCVLVLLRTAARSPSRPLRPTAAAPRITFSATSWVTRAAAFAVSLRRRPSWLPAPRAASSPVRVTWPTSNSANSYRRFLLRPHSTWRPISPRCGSELGRPMAPVR